MKKLIALLLGVIYSVFSNLTPVTPKEMPYVTESEYVISNQEDINYKQLYELYNTTGEDETQYCKKETYNSDKDKDKTIVPSEAGYYRYWIQPGKPYPGTGITDVKKCKITPEKGEQLIAPIDCTILTLPFSEESQKGGLRLQVGEQYILEFINLKCWYCCAHKEEPENGVYIHNGPNYPPKGWTIEAGKVIGVADSDTEFNVYTVSNGKIVQITYDEFFVGKAPTG